MTRIIEQITRKEGLASIEGNQKDFCVKRAINLFCNKPSSLLNQLSKLSIHNKMVVNTKMNHRY
jgi:hypothetical protein